MSAGGTGIRTVKQWANYIDNVIKNALGDNVKQLARGRTAYWDDELRIVIIHDPNSLDLGTAFSPNPTQFPGRTYFDNNLQ